MSDSTADPDGGDNANGPKVLGDAATYDGPAADGGLADAGGCGPSRYGAMVALDFADAGSYCIDTTEVTNEHYGTFLEAGVAFDTQLPECSWNKNWAPNCGGANTGAPAQPVTCVDWCDAYAFCKWAGKRLCGKIGASGANNPPSALVNPFASEWYAACSAGGTKKYPYGNAAAKGACPSDNAPITNVATNKDCVGGYPGLSEMAGNAGEWEGSCDKATAGDAGGADHCQIRGGDVYDKYDEQTCAQPYDQTRGFRGETTGFRCCRDLDP